MLQKVNYNLKLRVTKETEKYKIFSFEVPKNLLKLEATFESVVNTHDPNMLAEFLHKNPYHPKALYHFGEYYRLQGNFKEANLMMEKLIFLYEDSMPYEFKLFEE